MDKRILGIIGMGPRGGYALENLILALKNKKSLSQIHILLFEETDNFGNGQVYDINQNQNNWINISERILLLHKRAAIDFAEGQIPSFPSYHEWINTDFSVLPREQTDTYPPRAKIGKYLQERFQTLVYPLLKAKIVSLFKERVEEVTLISQNKISIKTNLKTYTDIDEVLLTIGHQQTELSKQISEWDKFVSNKKNIVLFKSPYPIAQFLMHEKLNEKSIIGVRGFGLAMIDVVRGIAAKYGSFIVTDQDTKTCIYESVHGSKAMFVPFSLDGLPPVPKPLNAQIDKWFEPTKAQISDFEKKIGNALTQKEAGSPYFLIRAFAPIAAKIYVGLPQSNLQEILSVKDIERIIVAWLQDYRFEHQIITPLAQSVKKTMHDFVGMATGREAISLDYCIGQVWRHCQPSIYKKLSFNECSPKVFAEIIDLDEATKRYSYGPPVESIQQMLALVEGDVMLLEMLNNPEIEMTNDGWCFHSKGKLITADVMINSVLDAPKIESVSSSIMKNLLSNNLIEAVHDELGVSTDENGYVMSENINNNIPIALLGRLAKGTIIGVDAILECFGTRPQKWAIEATNHHVDWLTENSAQKE